MCLITNQTKIICLALYMQNYRWSKYDAMDCIPLIGLYNTPYYDVESVGGFFYFSFRVFPLFLGFPFGRHLRSWGLRNLG
jgi:hypothetical protein